MILGAWFLVEQVIKIAKWIWYKIFPFTMHDVFEIGRRAHWEGQLEGEAVEDKDSFLIGYASGYLMGAFYKVKPVKQK